MMIVALFVLIVILFVLLIIRTVNKLYNSVHLPFAEQKLIKGDTNKLFYYIPELSKHIPYICFSTPSPIHQIEIDEHDCSGIVLLKREDLLSPMYGGNKVRSLEYLIPTIKALVEQDSAEVYVFGGPGSNQCVATTVFGKLMGVDVVPVWSGDEVGNVENGMNLISAMSFSNRCMDIFGSKLRQIQFFLTKVFTSNSICIMPGGAHHLGILGHLSAVLEVGEDIKNGKIEEIDNIFLPIGSGCTTAGLIVGISLARKFSLGFQKDIRIQSVVIHPGFEKIPFVQKLWIKYLVNKTTSLIKELGCVDISQEAIQLIDNLVLVKGYAGKYGGATDEMERAKTIFERSPVTSMDGEEQTHPWLCSCFSGKCGAALLTHMKKNPQEKNLFWCTKSVVQPLSSNHHWEDTKQLDYSTQYWLQAKCNLHESNDYANICTIIS